MKITKNNETTTHQQLPLSQETPKPPFRLQGLTDLFGEAGRPGMKACPIFPWEFLQFSRWKKADLIVDGL